MTLRPLTLADAAQVYELDQSCFPPGIAYSEDEVAAYLGAAGFHRGCEDPDRRLLGVVLSVQRRGWGHIITIDVDADARRRGIGQKLMQAAEMYYRECGARGMRLEAAVNNSAALAFYTRLGYRVLRRLAGYYAADLDALRLERSF